VTFSRFVFIIGLGMVVCHTNSDGVAQQMTTGRFKILFDGTSLDAWRGYGDEAIGQGWKIVDGALLFDGSGGGDIVTKEEFGDFELRFDWRVPAGSNSGVMYRVGMGDKAPYLTGPEYQILDDAGHADGKNPLTSAASLYGLYAPQNKCLNPLCCWNSAKIIAKGNRIEHWLNGTMVLEAEIGSDVWNERIQNSKFKDWAKFATLSSGRVCLQDHGNETWFRQITIQVFDASPPVQGVIQSH
jgi:Domain of Unknown Function (DUF1080)